MKKIFIDGGAGTTGLRIVERLSGRKDIELIVLPDSERKDINRRRQCINESDVTFLCLPDDAAREAVTLVENENTVIIDASTAHRTLPEWAYAFPELSEAHLEKIKTSKRIAVPGCHAGGFIALVYPLVEAGALSPDEKLCCVSLTGYSGGGKSMIADYNNDERSPLLDGPRQYGLTQQHKHLKEMKAITGMNDFPIFTPIVGDFYSGMEVTVPLFASQLENEFGIEEIRNIYKNKYNGKIVTYRENTDESGFLSAVKMSGKDTMEISVFGNNDRILLTARYDNLGKGASGAAIEAMNIALGIEKETGLEI